MSCDTNPPDPAPSAEINPVNINEKGFEFLDHMQGHWVGMNQVLSWNWDWFAFDYRPISSSHVFGIFEGGAMGNLLTSFFVTDFKGTRTIMARNGGLLSSIYRTSYFVLDSVRSENGEDYYRLVDAFGGAAIMYMELNFKGDSLYFNAYTSRLGENTLPTRHMTFKGKKEHLYLANTAATATGFPENTPAWDFSQGFNEDFLYIIPNETAPKSASFLAQNTNGDVYQLANESGDPFKIQDHPYVSTLQIDIDRNPDIQDANLFIYLSDLSLTDNTGIFDMNNFNNVLHFPELGTSLETFTFTYLHPGTYYVTVIADKSRDGIPGAGDITHVSQQIEITPANNHQISITDITVQN